jgi:lipopolysaccharide/colanic/teichoic acid biosynthesis glycosyltransferase
MQLLIYPEITDGGRSNLLERLFAASLAAEMMWEGLLVRQCRRDWAGMYILPPSWISSASLPHRIESQIFDAAQLDKNDSAYVLIHHGRFLTDVSSLVFQDIICNASADVIAVNASPRLTAFSETPRIVEGLGLVGIRRPYTNINEPVLEMMDWPHHLLIRKNIFAQVKTEWLEGAFKTFLGNILSGGNTPVYLETGGNAIDLGSGEGLLSLLTDDVLQNILDKNQPRQHPSIRMFGNVLCDRQVQIEHGVVLAEPVVICRGAKIGAGTIIKNAVIGPDVAVPSDQVIMNRVLWGQQAVDSITVDYNISHNRVPLAGTSQTFRYWSRWSYIHCGKRLFDILFSLMVLTICLPIFLIVFAAIKITSPGSVFYRARRQGIYGKAFDCLKFRTMILRADALQDRLRVVNQVDGPQFKMEDDPRITGVGKFLRDTCIDEIPQFVNVLMGQMSVVGPRPSPEEENRTCPPWRDARLSVRPGITGLWQISRTRKAGMDFQEWVYYDMEYVRKISFWMDLKVCIQTVMHLAAQFFAQFG